MLQRAVEACCAASVLAVAMRFLSTSGPASKLSSPVSTVLLSQTAVGRHAAIECICGRRQAVHADAGQHLHARAARMVEQRDEAVIEVAVCSFKQWRPGRAARSVAALLAGDRQIRDKYVLHTLIFEHMAAAR